MMKKKIIVPTMVAVLALSLVACTSTEPTPNVSTPDMDSSISNARTRSYGMNGDYSTARQNSGMGNAYNMTRQNSGMTNDSAAYRNSNRMVADAKYRASGDGTVSRGHGGMAKDGVGTEFDRMSRDMKKGMNSIGRNVENAGKDMKNNYMNGMERSPGDLSGNMEQQSEMT